MRAFRTLLFSLLLGLSIETSRADMLSQPSSIPTIDTTYSDNLPAIATLAGRPDAFKAGSGMFYSIHGGAKNATSGTIGTSIGFDFKYVGVELVYDRTAIIGTRLNNSNSTGAKIYFQYPIGSITPYLTTGMNLKYLALGGGSSFKMQRSFGGGLNWRFDDRTTVFISYTFADMGTGTLFKKGEHTYKAGFIIKF